MHNAPLAMLGGLSAEQFLADYWQKKPLLVRQAFEPPLCAISPEELAGLALEEGIEARIVQEHHPQGRWHLHRGPFTEGDFLSLPPTHWTLLVQQLDAWVPDVHALKQRFRFIPDWRIDDIMASYAPEGGSVGPHFDYYDVFLVQAQGEREWRLGQMCNRDTPRIDGTELNILAEFNEHQRYVLAPGDMLYLPPRLAHYGIALNRCITLSVGFRAPSHQQVIDGFSTHALERLSQERFYEDPDLQPATRPGEISPSSIVKLREIVNQALQDDLQLAKWFGTFATEPKNTAILLADDDIEWDRESLLNWVQSGEVAQANEGSRIAYINTTTGICLFIDGLPMDLALEDLNWVQGLCESQQLHFARIPELNTRTALQDYLLDCLAQGSLHLEVADE